MVLAIGVYDADALPSRWSYWAELQTPLEILKERDEKRRLLDLAILRIRGTLVLQPAVFTGTSTRYQVHREGDEAPPQFSDTLRLGRPADVTSGSPLIVLGWPSPDGQTSIFVDTTHECLAREGTIIRTRAFIHAGSSGGPALNSALQVVGVVSHNPRESDDTLGLDETRYLACIRSTEVDGSDPAPTPYPSPYP